MIMYRLDQFKTYEKLKIEKNCFNVESKLRFL